MLKMLKRGVFQAKETLLVTIFATVTAGNIFNVDWRYIITTALVAASACLAQSIIDIIRYVKEDD